MGDDTQYIPDILFILLSSPGKCCDCCEFKVLILFLIRLWISVLVNTGELVFLYYSDNIFGINNNTSVNVVTEENDTAEYLLYVLISLIILAFCIVLVSSLLVKAVNNKDETSHIVILSAKLYCTLVDGLFLAFAITIADSLDAALPFYKVVQDGINYGPWIISLLTFIELILDVVEVIAELFMIFCCGIRKLKN